MTNPFDGALCVGRWELFDSVDPNEHRFAKQFCDACPAALACLGLLRETQKSSTGGRDGAAQGTWAGQLVGTQAHPRECGTKRGYYQHRHYGEKTCAPCREAHRHEEWQKSRRVAS